MHIIVHPDHLEELAAQYENLGHFEERHTLKHDYREDVVARCENQNEEAGKPHAYCAYTSVCVCVCVCVCSQY